MSTEWIDTPLFTVDNPGISSAELADRARRQLRDELVAQGRMIAQVTRKRQGKSKQQTLNL